MRILEVSGEEAIDLLADLIDSAVELMTDEKIASAVRVGMNMAAVKYALKNHKKTVLKFLAICDTGEDVETYASKVKVATLPKKLLEIFNNPDIAELFTSQEQETPISSTPAMENTTETEME